MKLHSERHGAGEPLVLLHGGLGAGAQFAPILPAFAGRTVITADLAGHGGTPDGHQPLLAALAAQQHRPGLGVDVVDVEADGLGDARAGGVQQFQQRPVPQGQRAVGGALAARRLQQRQHLVDGQALGQPAARRRR